MSGQEHIAFVTYETQFAPCGGIAAVIKHLPRAISKAAGQSVFVITPFHHLIEQRDGRLQGKAINELGVFTLSFQGREQAVAVCELVEGDIHWVFLKASAPDFFAGTPHPYAVGTNLTRDTLFFGAAAARCLSILGGKYQIGDWSLLLQDWEAATTALAIKSLTMPSRCFITLHNSYDSYAYDHDLTDAGMEPWLYPGDTILQRALGVSQEPVFTVSEQFALDLLHDPLQSQVLAPHLPWILRDRLVGVNNGSFASLALPETEYQALREGDSQPTSRWKQARRNAFLEATGKAASSKKEPLWGEVQAFSDLSRQAHNPWFIMAGRDDPRQKGYDVLAYAVDSYFRLGGLGQFIMFPIPGDEGLEGLFFLNKLAQRHTGRVLVFPYIFREGYMDALQGATFGIMPSLYEPFGAASEIYMNGALGIARATGGLIQQIIPMGDNQQIRTLAGRWHAPQAAPTGILYREPMDIPNLEWDWRAINSCDYDLGDSKRDRLAQRSSYTLFREMGNALCQSLLDAQALFLNNSQLYHQMLSKGIEHIQTNFSWEKSARNYLKYI